jgi:hypothetical protein
LYSQFPILDRASLGDSQTFDGAGPINLEQPSCGVSACPDVRVDCSGRDRAELDLPFPHIRSRITQRRPKPCPPIC